MPKSFANFCEAEENPLTPQETVRSMRVMAATMVDFRQVGKFLQGSLSGNLRMSLFDFVPCRGRDEELTVRRLGGRYGRG